jgi:predicted  nucleic acid-binding Zn-ribbon protein
MASPLIAPLLILQDRDVRRLGLENQLKALPKEVALVEHRIASERAAIDAAKGELRELESKKKLLETEIGSMEQKLGQYRTQQLSVKKNDEYQALGNQIESVQKQIGEMEGQELEVMYNIDEAKKRFAQAQANLQQNIAGHEGRIRMLREREASVAEELKAAQAETAAARVGLAPDVLSAYDRASSRGLPAVVPIHGNKCGGCHLKVSSEVESAARGKAGDEFPVCDQCGRVVYWEA